MDAAYHENSFVVLFLISCALMVGCSVFSDYTYDFVIYVLLSMFQHLHNAEQSTTKHRTLA